MPSMAEARDRGRAGKGQALFAWCPTILLARGTRGAWGARRGVAAGARVFESGRASRCGNEAQGDGGDGGARVQAQVRTVAC